MIQSDYFHRVAQLTPTKMWINNVTREEAAMAIKAGAVGCTQNPSYTWKMLNHPQEKDYARTILKETMAEYSNDYAVASAFQRKLISGIAEVFLPLHKKSHGALGYVSIQGDPVHEHDPQVIIDEARLNREISPNMMIKIPATQAGLRAMEVLIAENTPLNATEVMSMSQVVQLCEMYRKIAMETGKKPIMYLSVITGIYDEWLRKEVEKEGVDISSDVVYMAGLAIAKKVYQYMHDKEYNLGFIGGGVRDLHHFTEMVGGDVCITMNWGGHVDKLLELNQPVVSRFFNPVQPEVLDELITKLPQFRQAYMIDGLKSEEFEEYGPVKYFWDSFVGAWKSVLEEISKMR